MASDDLFAPLFGELTRVELASKDNIALAARMRATDAQRWEELLQVLRDRRTVRLKEFEQAVKAAQRAMETQMRDAREKKVREEREQASDDVYVPTDFITNDKGVIMSRPGNIRLALQMLQVTLEFNEFDSRIYVRGWAGNPNAQELGNSVQNDLWVKLDDAFGFQPNRDTYLSTLEATARQRSFHPVKDYWATCKWDGKPRLARWLTTYMGVEDSAYTRAVGTLTLKAAVKRVFEPGCQFDEMLLLGGEQGLGKSTAFASLCGDFNWFTDSIPLMETDARIIEASQGKQICEISDMRGSTKAEDAFVKAQLSRRVDKARLAYARLAQNVPRQFIFVGSFNGDTPLTDPSGNRRYWPVICHPVNGLPGCDVPGIIRDRDQLWAEAVSLYIFDGNVRLDPSLYPAAREAQKGATRENPFTDKINLALGDKQGWVWAETVWEILRMVPKERTPHYTNFGHAMAELGWVKGKKRPGKYAGPAVMYQRGTSNKHIVLTWDEGAPSIVYAAQREDEPLESDE